ncbi:MAG TPA: T9SS type A sorting domain-containing protein [Bacteroidia bacterium]|nr:T9SS type A sorting domain-containing protein [Bacteroidia bacterium]
MKKHLLTIAAFALIGAVRAQTVMPQVVSSSGGSGQNAQVSLDWTIGETVTSTVSDGQSTLTQGFQQPTLQIATTQNEKNDLALMLVYPNPTADFVTLKINQSDHRLFNYKVHDVAGKLVIEGKASTNSPNISFQGLASGQYTLSLIDNELKSQSISIIKQN